MSQGTHIPHSLNTSFRGHEQGPDVAGIFAPSPVVAAVSQRVALAWTVLVVFSVMAVHLSAPFLQCHIRAREEQLNSLGRGLAVAYVFLHLFAEISAGDELFGKEVYFIVLIGFLVYYGIEHRVEYRLLKQAADPDDPLIKLHFGLVILLKWVYTWLLVYALPTSIREQGFQVIPAVIAISLHILHDDVEIAARFQEHYNHEGRDPLASAAVVGWLCDLYVLRENPYVSKALTAVLAGSVLYTTFSGELQNHRKSRFAWFVGGVGLFLLLYMLSGE